MTDFGLPERTIDEITAIFSKFEDIEKVVIYGSRAKGNYKYNSDIDMTIFAPKTFTHNQLLSIIGYFDDSDIPYLTDISIYSQIENPALVEHIDRVGKIVYSRNK